MIKDIWWRLGFAEIFIIILIIFLPSRTHADSEQITIPKIIASFRFKEGVNTFAFPFTIIPSEYTTEDLWRAIEDAEGKQGIVESIYVFENKKWERTYKDSDPNMVSQIVNINPVRIGKGAFIIMNQSMTKEVVFYGNPISVRVDLYADALNVIIDPVDSLVDI